MMQNDIELINIYSSPYCKNGDFFTTYIDGIAALHTLNGDIIRTFTSHQKSSRSCQKILYINTTPTSFVATAGWDKKIYLYDMYVSNPVHCLQAHVSGICALSSNVPIINCINNSSNTVNNTPCYNQPLLISGGWDRNIYLWDLRTLRKPFSTFYGHKRCVNCIDVLPTGEIISTSRDRTLRIWDIDTSQCLSCINTGGSANSLLVLPNGSFITGSKECLHRVVVSNGYIGSLDFWDVG